MNKSILIRSSVIAGGMLALCMSFGSLATAFNPTNKTDNLSKVEYPRIAGETPETLRAYKQGCPDCVRVAEDVSKMRQQYCADRNANVDTAIVGDPVYAYLNGVRMVLSTRGGYNSALYTSARQIVEANVDCVDSQDWVDRSQRVLTQTFNKGQALH